jgi:hypothetical protein
MREFRQLQNQKSFDAAMMAIVPQMRLLVAVEPVDFRRGINGLVAVCRQQLQADDNWCPVRACDIGSNNGIGTMST